MSIPARFRGGGFQGREWVGQSVIVTISSTQSVRDAYATYAKLADQDGWTAAKKVSMDHLWHIRYPGVWVKHIAGRHAYRDLRLDFSHSTVDVTAKACCAGLHEGRSGRARAVLWA
ncbi:hypothetical protein BIV57_01135 [Mangrovactinospora gilvigrisea]|uniref:Uncharacterized protein n=1 Tax=Mangrovactinospora gilvigrisea TaxID=1428644 RepID=A0A1J7BL85_9ACTN|nr:hypothetical protein BIV57_01135 [Mangrovactinospora gilvigrisea]